MPDITLFINTNGNALMAGLTSTQAVASLSIPFFYNDTIGLKIYNLEIPDGYNPNDQSNNRLAIKSTAGKTLWFYIDDGTIGGTIYASQLVFVPDANNQYFTGTLALTTAPLLGLIGAGTGASAWVKIGYTENGIEKTVFSGQVNIGVGKPTAAIPAVAQGLTALSKEAADQAYLPVAPKNGQAILFASPLGKMFALLAVDNADGTASVLCSPAN